MTNSPARVHSRGAYGDTIFKYLVEAFGLFLIFLVVLYIFELTYQSLPSIKAFGFSYVFGSEWNAPRAIFQALPEILGTLASSAIALIIGVPISLGVAVFLAELAPSRVKGVLGPVIELLAAVPSIVFGFWGLAVLVPQVMRPLEHVLQNTLGFLPIFRGQLAGTTSSAPA